MKVLPNMKDLRLKEGSDLGCLVPLSLVVMVKWCEEGLGGVHSSGGDGDGESGVRWGDC